MSNIKEHLEHIHQAFVVYMFIKDGCPPDEAHRYDFEDLVDSFYEGNTDLAMDEAMSWHETLKNQDNNL